MRTRGTDEDEEPAGDEVLLAVCFLQLGAEIEVVARGTRVPVGRGGRKPGKVIGQGADGGGGESAVRSILHPIGG